MCKKAMLMIDMPESCHVCPCGHLINGTYGFVCGLANCSDCPDVSIPKWCPLVPLEMRQMDSILRAVSDSAELYKIGL